jgi:epoxyqueuosine reductase QueG
MMHPEYGLWHSYRFALLGAEFESDQAPPVAASPCLDCSEKPCLQRCPVGAFDESGYDVERCASYLQQTPLAECHALGCLARYACPVAPELRYIPAQGRFHLQAFLDARR